MGQHLRKKKYCDRQVQGALIRRIMLHWVCFAGTAMFATVLLQFLFSEPGTTLNEHLEIAWSRYALSAVILLALLPAFVLDTVKLSNRFVGPIVRLRRGLHQLAEEGTCEPLQFREDDFWQEIARDFNTATNVMRMHHQSQQEESQQEGRQDEADQPEAVRSAS